jgi:hypothetical protein
MRLYPSFSLLRKSPRFSAKRKPRGLFGASLAAIILWAVFYLVNVHTTARRENGRRHGSRNEEWDTRTPLKPKDEERYPCPYPPGHREKMTLSLRSPSPLLSFFSFLYGPLSLSLSLSFYFFVLSLQIVIERAILTLERPRMAHPVPLPNRSSYKYFTSLGGTALCSLRSTRELHFPAESRWLSLFPSS